MLRSNKGSGVIQLILTLISLVLVIFYVGFYYTRNLSMAEATSFLEKSVIIIYLYVLLSSKLFFKWNNSFILFLLSFGLFLLSRVFFSVIFGDADIYIADKLTYYQIEPKTISTVLLTFIVSLLTVHIGGIIPMPQFGGIRKIVRIQAFNSNKNRKILLFLVVLLLPGTLMKLIYDYKQILSSGYLIAFSAERVQAPLLLRLCWFILKSFAPLLVVFVKRKKDLIAFVSLMVVIDIANILAGNRSNLLAPFAFFFWYYYKFISTKLVKIYKLVIIGICVIVFSIVSINLRDEAEVMKFDLKEYSHAFFYSQGVSYLLNVYYHDFDEKLVNPSRLAMFHPLYNYYLMGKVKVGHSEEYVEKTISLDHKITYAVSPNAYLNGQGLGTSYIIELYALGGMLALIIGSFFLGRIIVWFERFFLIREDYRFVSWFWIYHLVTLPRSGLIPDLTPLLLCFIIMMVLRALSRKNVVLRKDYSYP